MKTYGIPILLWLAAIGGLVVALLADGALEVCATVVAATPLFVILRFVRSASRKQTAKVLS